MKRIKMTGKKTRPVRPAVSAGGNKIVSGRVVARALGAELSDVELGLMVGVSGEAAEPFPQMKFVPVAAELAAAADVFGNAHGLDPAALVHLALSAYMRLQADLCFCLHSRSLHEEGGSQKCMLKSCTCRRFLGIGLGMVGKLPVRKLG